MAVMVSPALRPSPSARESGSTCETLIWVLTGVLRPLAFSVAVMIKNATSRFMIGPASSTAILPGAPSAANPRVGARTESPSMSGAMPSIST